MSEWVKRNSVWGWVLVLIALIIVLNWIAFRVYSGAHPTEEFWAQFWTYLESDSFKTFTLSLILPVIMLILENHFKLIETWKQDSVTRARKAADDRTEKCWEAIVRTQELWNQLYCLTSQVIYFNPKNPPKDGPFIEDILQSLENFANFGEDVVNLWRFRFPNLDLTDLEKFLLFVNVLLQSAMTVAFAIQENVTSDAEIKVMQAELGVIQEDVRSKVHYPILIALGLSRDLNAKKDLIEIESHIAGGLEQSEKDKVDAEVRELEANIQYYLNIITAWINELTDEVAKQFQVLSAIDGHEVTAFREQSDLMIEKADNDPNAVFSDPDENQKLRQLFENIPYNKRLDALTIPYSREYLTKLADWMSYAMTRSLVVEQVRKD